MEPTPRASPSTSTVARTSAFALPICCRWSLASCSGVDVVSQLGDDALTALSIEVTYNKEPDPPWKFQRFRLHYRLSGPSLTADRVEAAIHRSHTEMCSVSAAVRGNVPIETTFELVP